MSNNKREGSGEVKSDDLNSKKTTLEDFKQLRSLGEGAFGEVHLVKNYFNNKQFALKSIDKSFIEKHKKEHHVYNERLILQKLDSDLVVRLNQTFQDSKKLYFLLENVPNGELAKYLRHKGKLPLEEVIFFAAEMVNILEYIHGMGVIHRDLKPENLLLTENNKLKIIDFGTAEVVHVEGKNDDLYNKYQAIRKKYAHESDDVMEFRNSVKPRKSFVGTVYYVAPEMLEHQSVDRGCDFWALGIIIYKMLTGEYLFNEANEYWIFQRIRECKYKVSDDLPDEAKDLIYELVKKESTERLGNGSSEDGRDIKALKKHPFFAGYDFDEHEAIPSPVKIDRQRYFSEREQSPEPRFFNNDSWQKTEKKIVLSGLVKKRKFRFLYNTRQLILYSNSSLMYFDPKSNRLKVR